KNRTERACFVFPPVSFLPPQSVTASALSQPLLVSPFAGGVLPNRAFHLRWLILREIVGMSSEKTSKGGIDQLAQDVSDLNLNIGKDGDWDGAAKKNTIPDGRLWGSQLDTTHTPLDPWKIHNLDYGIEAGKGGSLRSVSTFHNDDGKVGDSILDSTTDVDDGDDTDTSSDDEYIGFVSDGFDSDECCHESRKKHRMLKFFFESLDKLTLDEVNSPLRRWHCPVCQNGPGAIFWYRGIHTLITHARTKGSIRPRLHRGFLELLDEELRRKFGSVGPAGESYSHCGESRKEGQDHAILWPSMVVVMNAALDKCNDKGMGVQELLDYFNSYAAVKTRHLYGPEGHQGISLLIFENSTVGYIEAERLHKHFLELGTGREAWEQWSKFSDDGGRHRLFGYLATKDDVELFNQHSRGKQRVKYELRSYSVMVSQLKQMSEENHQLTKLKLKVAEEKKYMEKLVESLSFVSESVKQELDEGHIVKQMSKFHYHKDQEQMDRKEVEEPSLCEEDHKFRMEEGEGTIKSQDPEKSHFVQERNGLVMDQERRKYECMKRCLDELLEIEKGNFLENSEVARELSPVLNNMTMSFTLVTHPPGGLPPPVALWFGMQPSGPTPTKKNCLNPKLYRACKC
ncbi:hypothetical protein V2J09_000676, partial [Rumex salicifolius]